MISATNPFFALSYANIASLFGAAAASPSGVTATIGGASSSASISSTNDPAKAIQAILAQAEVAKAPAAAANASGVSSTVESAYAAQTTAPAATASGQASSAASGPSSTDVETGANLDATKAQLATTQAMFSSLFSEDHWLPYTSTAFVAQATTTDTATSAEVQVGSGQASSAAATLTASVSSARTTSTISMSSISGGVSTDDPVAARSGASLVVTTTSGMSVVGVGNSNSRNAAMDMATLSLVPYRPGLPTANEAGTSQKYLHVTIADWFGNGTNNNLIQSQAQTLITAFETGKLAASSSTATGFTYESNGTNDDYDISGAVVDARELELSMNTTDPSNYLRYANPDYAQLNAISAAAEYSSGGSGPVCNTSFWIPIGADKAS